MGICYYNQVDFYSKDFHLLCTITYRKYYFTNSILQWNTIRKKFNITKTDVIGKN